MENKEKTQYLAAFGKTVKQRRLELGLSQETFAEKSQLHRTYISGIERGKRNVAFLNVIQILKALEITPKDFFQKIQEYIQENFHNN